MDNNFSDNDLISIIKIKEGEKVHTPSDIYRSRELTKFVFNNRLRLPMSIAIKVKDDEGYIVIYTGSNLNDWLNIGLEDVSKATMDEFLEKYA